MTTRDTPIHREAVSGEPIGLACDVNRAASAEDGSRRLAARINALIDKTARTIDVPPQYRRCRREFAEAYLGIEI